jgi:hypothetical protein
MQNEHSDHPSISPTDNMHVRPPYTDSITLQIMTHLTLQYVGDRVGR